MIGAIASLLLLAAPSDGGTVTNVEQPASIAGAWRCFDGDDAAFAGVGFDDSRWKAITLPEDGGRVCGDRISWLRRHIVVSAAHAAPLGVAVGNVDGAYEVFVDGVRVGGHGVLEPLKEPIHTGEAFAIPDDALADGAIDVAVRIANNPVLYAFDPGRRLVPAGPLVIGQMPAVDEHVRVIVRDEARDRVGGFMSLGILFAFVCFYHVIVWVLRRDQWGYLWFGISSTLVVLYLSCLLLRSTENFPVSSTDASVVGNFFGSLVNAAFIEFFFRFVQKKSPTKWWRVYQAALVVIAFLGFIPEYGLMLCVTPPVILAKVAMPISFLILLVRWTLKGNRDAIVLIAALIIGAIAAPIEVLVEHGGGKLPISVSPALVAFAFFTVVMAVALSAQFARTLEEVDTKNKQLRDINASISRFVPFGFLEALEKKTVQEVERGDSRKQEMAVMFCDVRGFTPMAEAMGPDGTFRFINEYLSRMEPEIYRGAGFINQYLGDGIMALFPTKTMTSGTTTEKRSGADGAVTAALGMVQALAKLNAEREKRGEAPVKIGAGIHLGQLMIGTIGGGEQIDGGVVGDVVNASSRIEGMTKMYSARVLLSGQVVAGLERVRPVLRHLDTVLAKGKTDALSIYEVLDCDEYAEEKKATLQTFTDAQRAYKAGRFADAAALFDDVIARAPHDGAARLLRDRCAELQETGFEGEWSGVYALTSKS